MPRRSCDGAGLPGRLPERRRRLEANVEEINALNVFRVPDGDTGTNMLATVRAALEEADKAGPGRRRRRVAHAVSFGALMGARGNSGVITSQILAGMAHGLPASAVQRPGPRPRARRGHEDGLQGGAKPVEGTILTVIREASAAAVDAAERDNNVETVLAATVDAAERAVAKTPSLLPILREAHVVDSGGQGLFRLFQGALEAARRAGRGPAAARVRPRRRRHRAPDRQVAPGVEDRRVRLRDRLPAPRPRGHPLDIPAIQRHLEAIGDSVLVAGDERLVKIHVHNDRPDAVIAYGLSIGTLTRITIENLDGQAHDVREAKAQRVPRRGRRRRRLDRDGRREGGGVDGDRRAHDADGRCEPPAAGHRRRRPRRTAWPRCSTSTRPGSGSSSRCASSAAARRPTRRPASCSRPSRRPPPTSC